MRQGLCPKWASSEVYPADAVPPGLLAGGAAKALPANLQ
jgi:hypothetical protein